jgi:7-cyano-7-deazaguanine reductase
VRDMIRRDISAAIWHGGAVQASVGVKLLLQEQFDAEPVHELDCMNLDRMDIECTRYEPAPDLLNANIKNTQYIRIARTQMGRIQNSD